MAKFAIIIATYGREKLLREAVRSLLAQTFQDWEAVIVDGSPLKSEQEFTDPRLKYYREQDHQLSGLVQARNFGVSQTDSKYIAYLDDDEYYYPSKLEVMHNFFEFEAPGDFAYHDVVVAVVHWVGDTLQHVCVPRPHWHPEGNPNLLIQKYNFIANLQAVHTRALFEQLGGFRENEARGIFQGRYRDQNYRFDEDADLYRRMARHTRFGRVPLQLAEYRVHGTNVNAWGVDYQKVFKQRKLEKAYY
ncbi:MAG TPA: glycosyltransferase family 2 protein [Anaerolineales bacterium]|nr:glycosyltransferase family 2 protein [Anaerolineales bacterium]